MQLWIVKYLINWFEFYVLYEQVHAFFSLFLSPVDTFAIFLHLYEKLSIFGSKRFMINNKVLQRCIWLYRCESS